MGTTAPATREQQSAFAWAVAQQLRIARKQQRLTQTDVAERTGGLVSKAALANYETGHRSIRIEVFWALATALGEDPGALLNAAERLSGVMEASDTAPITVNVQAIEHSTDPLLAPVRRWFALRARVTARGSLQTISLDAGALAALAELMGIDVAACRRLLVSISDAEVGRGGAGAVGAGGATAGGTTSYPLASTG